VSTPLSAARVCSGCWMGRADAGCSARLTMRQRYRHRKAVSSSTVAEALWDLLYKLPRVHHTTASKLLARKRPILIPITGSIIVSVGTPGETWLHFTTAFGTTFFASKWNHCGRRIRSASACSGSSTWPSGCYLANLKRPSKHDVESSRH
jgi:Family of unknown function (DUF6308)